MTYQQEPTRFVDVATAARRNNISASLVRRMARAGRIPNAIALGEGQRKTWAIPVIWVYVPNPPGRPAKRKE